MNRKEIIVFSVFVNSFLLVTLFMFALRPTLKGEVALDAVTPVAAAPEKVIEKKPEIDQVDQILKEYIAKKTTPEKKEQQGSLSNELVASSRHVATKAAKAAPKKQESKVIEVIVRQGDMLEKIARRHRTTVREIMKLNDMSSTTLRIGQILLVQENTRKKVPMNKNVKATRPKEQYYTVKNGDNPWKIAIKNHIKVTDLIRLNGLTEAKAKRLKPGDKLKIR